MFVYILRTIDDRLYVGSTRELSQRWDRHQKGSAASFTKAHKPMKLVYVEKHHDLVSARRREVQIKRWSRKKKEALISGSLQQLKRL